MNDKIEQLINNCLTHCRDLVDNNQIKYENMFKNPIIKGFIDVLYENQEEEVKNSISYEDLINHLKEYFKKETPTIALAESDELENWLDSSMRIKRENRFNAYKKFLTKEGKKEIVESMVADTYKILDSCHNPNKLEHEWDRRGLVYGHVQSGKTANYVGLINRAFDAGYQIVIVLTGMTEDLRQQTQARIDAGVIGSSLGEKKGIGKNSRFDKLERIRPATSIKKDLKKSDDIENHLSTRDKSIWVVKKNKTVLENLILWLDKQRGEGDEKIHNVPFLIIDDEADNASIQSLSKKEYEEWDIAMDLNDLENLTEAQEKILEEAQNRIVKAINRNIRVALSLMSHKTFVGYTATPYSIINQPDKDLERKVTIRGKEFKIDVDDLFPEHFIIPINPGKKYMGIEKVFTTNKTRALPVIKNLSTTYPNEDLDNNYFPTKRGEGYSFIDLPKSLEDAILHFLVSIIIRKHRGHEDYNTMLIHTSHLTDNADYVAHKIHEFIMKLMDYLPSDSGGYFARAEKIFQEIKENSSNTLFDEYFNHRNKYTFPDCLIKKNVLDVVHGLTIVSYHSSNRKDLKHHEHKLNFTGDKYEDYIVIGGNRLSRGLTLEGLISSYFVRNSTRQDSLYQMGRWFGYRIGFEDLVRIYMPADQIYWFNIIYELEMDLRKDFNNYNDDDIPMLPRDYAIKLACRTNPKFITNKKIPFICDPNKLRNTSKKLMTPSQNLNIKIIIDDVDIQKHNMGLLKNFLENIRQDQDSSLFESNISNFKEIRNNQNINYKNVNFSLVTNFLTQYNAHDSIKSDIDTLITFINKNNKELSKWSVVIVNRGKTPKKSNYIEDNKGNKINIVERKSVSEPKDKSLYFKQILEGRNKDYLFDIIENQEEYNIYDKSEKKNTVVKEYRNKKKKPIIIIYPTHSKGQLKGSEFPLIYCFVPVLENAQKVTYIVRNRTK